MTQELIFCCRHCLGVDSTAVIVDSNATVEAISCLPLVIQCRHCDNFNCVPVSNTMVSSFFGASGFKTLDHDYPL